MVGNSLKLCRICKDLKELKDFGIKKGNTDGRDSRCKPCKQELHVQHGILHPFNRLHVSKKAKCAFLNIPYNLDIKYLKALWVGTCPVFELPLQLNEAQLDRLYPTLGYIKGNVNFLSVRANRLKSDANSDELRKIADWID